MVWLEFAACSSLMIFFAYHLCKEGVILSRKTRIEEGLIGMFFLALATSLPEVATGSTAIFFLGRIGLGYGDIVGSIIVNLMILLWLDYYAGKGRILRRVSRVNRMTGVFSLLLISIVLVFAVLRSAGVLVPLLKRVGAESVLIVVIYIGCLEAVRRSSPKGTTGETYKTKGSLLSVWSKFVLLLGIVMFLGLWLAKTGEKIAATTNLSQTFIGALFLGLSTSFPEMIVSFTALRAGSVNMAVGNILGSNLFDVFIVPFLDGLCGGAILGMLTPGQIIATSVAVLLSFITVLGLFIKKDAGRRINWDTGLIFAVGLTGFVLLYFIR